MEAPARQAQVVVVMRVAAACDGLVALPMRGRIGSLNVSAAAAALLYGILHARDSA